MCLAYGLFMAVSHYNSRVVATEPCMAHRPKIFTIYPFIGKGCQPLVYLNYKIFNLSCVLEF